MSRGNVWAHNLPWAGGDCRRSDVCSHVAWTTVVEAVACFVLSPVLAVRVGTAVRRRSRGGQYGVQVRELTARFGDRGVPLQSSEFPEVEDPLGLEGVRHVFRLSDLMD